MADSLGGCWVLSSQVTLANQVEEVRDIKADEKEDMHCI